MELCGTSLQDRLQESVLSREKRVSIWRDIARALQFCHNSAVIHADVKATNILMAADDRAKLTDFGSSILIGEPHISIKPRVRVCNSLNVFIITKKEYFLYLQICSCEEKIVPTFSIIVKIYILA